MSLKNDASDYYLPIIVSMLLGVLFCSCKKSNNDSLSSAANNVAEAAKFAITNGANLETNRQLLSTANEAAEAFREAMTNEVNQETAAAATALNQLHDQGRLPGNSKNEPGQVTSDTVQLVISNNAVIMAYPASRTFHFVKDGETATNNYMLVKQSSDSEWKLQRAWLTDSNGQTVQQWTVP